MSTRKFDRDVQVPLSFGTIQQLRSATFQFHALDALTAKPDQAYLTRDNKLLYQDCRPTDSLQYTFMAKGMVSRLGDDPKPSMALLDQHVRCLDSELDALF
ncbi:unnamed protein product [Cylindrotheca closterium]|uniref:Uncharacterized protein n=1 Tax=Cylindrotheca closterium TaxID=2856 RepID=A0AAD2G105_9STRA|nr:unnamed protein product [Cylindrotheca closterium]